MDLVAEHRPLDLRQIQAQQIHGGDLRDERLGGGDGHFRTGMGVEHGIGFPRNRRALRIADGQHLGTLLTGVAKRHQGIHGFTGLGNRHHQCTRGEDRIPVAELVREFHLHGDAHPVLDRVFGHLSRVAGRAAGDYDDLVDRLEIMLVDMHFVEVQIAVGVKAPQQRTLHGGRILVDLLVHKGIPTALLGGGRIPIHGVGVGMLNHIAVEVGDNHPVGGHADNLVLIDFHGALGVGDKGRDIGTEEILPVSKPDHQRRVMARADHDIRLPAVGGENGERAVKHARQTAHGFEQIRMPLVLDDLVDDFAQQFGGHFGVGAG